MNTIEIIQAAHDKLWAQRELTLVHAVGRWNNTEDPQEVTGSHGAVGEFWATVCADLVVTLHRTIDAQLAILQSTLDEYERWGDRVGRDGIDYDGHVRRLALAILGESA